MESELQERLFAAALIEGTDEAFEALIGVGPIVVTRFRDELTRKKKVSTPPGTSTKSILDNVSTISFEIASAYPDEFLKVFDDPAWDGDRTVCTGLGAIRRPRVTRRLMRYLQSDDHWLRVTAAVALRGHQHRGLRSVLTAALNDPDDLVQWHVEQRLDELDAESAS